MTVNSNDISRVTAKMKFHGADAVQNVYHVQNISPTGVDDDDYRTHISKWLDAAYQCINGLLHNGITYDTISIYNITQDRPLPDVDWDTLTVGALAENDLPAGVAALITFDTDTKKITGKKYLAGWPISAVDNDGNFVSAVATVLLCMALKLYGTQTFFTINSLPGTWRQSTLKFTKFQSASIDLIPAYQRRRRPGTGE